MSALYQDVCYALRTLRKNPGFAATALLTIALAIGAATSMFSIVNGVLLRSLPYPEADRLVRLYEVDPNEGLARGRLSLPDLEDWRSRSGAFASAAAYSLLPEVLLGRGDPLDLRAAYVTGTFFDVLGSPMLLGRPLDFEDAQRANRNVVISSRIWRSRFGADPNVVGTTASLRGERFTIVGVAKADFRFPRSDVALWIPQAVLTDRAIGARTRDNRTFEAVARLSPGVSIDGARARVRAVAGQLSAEYPSSNAQWSGAALVPLRTTIVGHVQRALVLVLAVVGFIALIACVNVANLLLARGAAREREIGTRMALGADRLRIARQLMTESGVLAVLGGLLGLGAAMLAMRLVVTLNADMLPRVQNIRIDTSVLAFAALVSLVAGALIGALPAWRIARSDPRRHLGTARGAGDGSGRVGPGLVAAEAALAVVLVVGAGLMARSFLLLRSVPPGFDAGHVLTVTLQMNLAAKPKDANVMEFLLQRRREITDRIAALPGVLHAAMTNRLALRDELQRLEFRRADGSGAAGGGPLTADQLSVSPDYFQAMGIPLLRGTTLTADANINFGSNSDSADRPLPVVVSASAAKRFWPKQDAVGKVIQTGRFQAVVVGVAADVRQAGLAEAPSPMFYFQDAPQLSGTLIVRAAGDPLLLAGPIRETIHALDPNQSIRNMTLLRDVLTGSIARDRFFTLLYEIFGGAALALAAVGVYGVVAYSVGRRTQEIGIRVAVGAQHGDIVRAVVGRGMRPVLAGVALGSGGALFLARAIAHQLYGIGANDPLTFVAAPAVLIVTAALACYVPARRASRIDPMAALRSE